MANHLSSFRRTTKPIPPGRQAKLDFEREMSRRLEAAERGDLHDEETVFDEIDRLIKGATKKKRS